MHLRTFCTFDVSHDPACRTATAVRRLRAQGRACFKATCGMPQKQGCGFELMSTLGGVEKIIAQVWLRHVIFFPPWRHIALHSRRVSIVMDHVCSSSRCPDSGAAECIDLARRPKAVVAPLLCIGGSWSWLQDGSIIY
jgi:hypothetical protein